MTPLIYYGGEYILTQTYLKGHVGRRLYIKRLTELFNVFFFQFQVIILKIYYYILIHDKNILLIFLRFNIKLDGVGLFAYFQYIREDFPLFYKLGRELR